MLAIACPRVARCDPWGRRPKEVHRLVLDLTWVVGADKAIVTVGRIDSETIVHDVHTAGARAVSLVPILRARGRS